MNMNQLVSGDQEFWLSQLPKYQQSGVQSMLSAGLGYEAAASAWMSGAVADGTAPFGAGLGPSLFFEKFLDQMHDFLCTGINYDQEREAIMSGFKPGQAGLAASISAAIAPHLDAAPAFLAPAVALLLCAIAKMGLAAWCQIQTDRRTAASPEPASPPPDS
ncbi:hypothetical protein ABZ322_21885 [Streptomyces sp. NPDC006129]|uniref:hypothetical protein n=1 Tax=Streptomyces sp. NPDC006129 TaxID=3155348 RepID=UPI0033A82733